MRTRTAANRAFSRPFVPLRQLTILHLAPASMSPAGIDRMSGTCRLRGLPRTLVIGQICCTPSGYTLRRRGIPTTHASLGTVIPRRNAALHIYPASVHAQTKPDTNEL